ncbi:uncharacterized protein LOC6573829 [Drosophila mojavensis]|uniref:Uncharacterized protein n=1 Tax=Drosophila mojavensis TaxID=7230 RepID=B4K7K5_DROMO|nr:uncharacterized protein LOC6573829 [Drosophila mojavensis]EDW15349.1 uncharacterized protein Dmoj_GI24776 [Drosophila mojavensis]
MQYLVAFLLTVGSALAIEELPDSKHLEPALQPTNATASLGKPGNTTKKEDPRLVNVPFTECKRHEVFTLTKGCVNRKTYMQDVIFKTWNDKSMERVRLGNDSGEIQCAINELHTIFGCEPMGKKLRDSAAPRAAVLPNYLHGSKIYNSKEAIPQTDDSEPILNGNTGTNPSRARDRLPSEKVLGRNLPVKEPESTAGAPGAGNATQGGSTNATGTPDEEVNEILQKVIGHNRKRKYSFLPGRLLNTYRKCRPYEVLGMGRRCIRKKGKVGFNKHRNHVYGIKKRHRKPASSPSKSKHGKSSAPSISDYL